MIVGIEEDLRAFTYIWANSGWVGNFSIDSTRYWYESRSDARI